MSVDLLNPLATLKWMKKEFKGVLPTTAHPPYPSMHSYTLSFKGHLVVGVTYLDPSCMLNDNCRSSLCFFDSHSWKMLPPLPCVNPGVSTYHSQLVLVGGHPNGKTVWVSEDDGYSWTPSLPLMPTERNYGPSTLNPGSTPECLIVTGGLGDARNFSQYTACTAVEVLMEGQWWTVPPLPYIADPTRMHLTLHGGNLYVYGDGHSGSIFYCDLQALIASCKPSKHSVSLWDAGWQCCNFTNNNVMISFQRQLFYFSTTSVSSGYLLSMHVIHNQSVVAIGTSEDGEAPDSDGCTELLPGENFSILDCTGGDLVLYTPSIKGIPSPDYCV